MTTSNEHSLIAEIKPELFLFDTEEINAETPAHLLDDEITPARLLFVRNTGRTPFFSDHDIANWRLTIDGEVNAPRSFTIAELQRDFEVVSEAAVLECAGNGRANFVDPTPGPHWRQGAVGCVRWTGVRLADLLAACGGVRPSAVYTAHHAPDVSVENEGPAISRGLPVAKALAPETLVAFEMNGEPLPHIHGGPLRLVAPGFPGSAWQKWLNRIELRDREHDGERMTGTHYRLPRRQVKPGEAFDDVPFDVITDMPVRSIITAPREGFTARAGEPLTVRGHAWSGHIPVEKVEVSADDGATWHLAKLAPVADRFAWRRFEATLVPARGEVALLARATDAEGNSQPVGSVAWNPRGYCNNAAHRVTGSAS